MCGRVAQSISGVRIAGSSLPVKKSTLPAAASATEEINEKATRMNQSPGCKSFVFTANASLKDDHIILCEKKWGLLTKSGTSKNPLPLGPGKHFSALMFNARSETAHEKYSFRNLIVRGHTCVIPINGFYEWKTPEGTDPKSVKSGIKQPYYVHRTDEKPFLVAGLCRSVRSGGAVDGDHQLETYTILTTNACPKLRWLHNRQPLLLKDESDALRWINHPSPQMLHQFYSLASATDFPYLTWIPVTKKINKIQYRGSDCNERIDPEKQNPSIKSFFGRKGGNSMLKKRKTIHTAEGNTNCANSSKNGGGTGKKMKQTDLSNVGVSHELSTSNKTVDKKATEKKGSITSFFNRCT